MELQLLAVTLFTHLLFLLQNTITVNGYNPIVKTEKGLVQGFRMTTNGKDLDAFFGIPYAKPPLGGMRFKPPIPVDPWDGILNATVKPKCCMQGYDQVFGNFSGAWVWNPNTQPSEDCLYLNVWVPKTNPPYENKAVMVWIYGGSFYSGSAALDIYDSQHLATENDVIVVAMQYRVGALGFLAMGHHEAPGNAGMFDQRLALEWVQRNIHHFGGSSKNVTLFGESAGAVSIGLHMVSPISRGLFDRAILQSGAPHNEWGTVPTEEGIRRGRLLAGFMDCDSKAEASDVIECLRNVPAEHFQMHEFSVAKGIIQFPFVPVVDGNFLVETPAESLIRGNFKRCPLLLGSNSNEGIWFLFYEIQEFFTLESTGLLTSEQFKAVLSRLFEFYPQYPHKQNDFGMDAIIFQYTNWLDPKDQYKNRLQSEQSVGDCHFVCFVQETASIYARAGMNVYSYLFDHRSSVSPWPEWTGVMHGDEIAFIFGEPLNANSKYLARERDLSRKLMRYWSNFAKTGDPNRGPGEMSLNEWPPFLPQTQDYLVLSTKYLHTADRSQAVRSGYKAHECAFWRNYLPHLVAGTADISDVEREWKLQFDQWKNHYIVDWKNQFDNFLNNYERRLQTCGGTP
ncbi:hypothetical protein SNE40_000445 [Patella caerulea]|uniref:Carboxylic ester hydrolase n=1 Tax=Patella caerulea TaxID=87958 RepID=A0AAN8KLA3_PATCE